MRTSTFARAGAVLTASALAITLGAGSASASEDVHTTRTFTTVPDAPAIKQAPQKKIDFAAAVRRSAAQLEVVEPDPVPDLKTFALARDQVLYAKGENNFLQGTVVIANEPTEFYNLTTLIFNTHVQTTYSPQLFSGTVSGGDGGVVISPSKGPGLYDFGPSGIWWGENFDTDYTEDTTHSNTIRVRNATSGQTTYSRSGKTHKVTANLKVFKPSVGIFGGGLTSARLQYKSGSSWKTYKTIKLNRYGKGSVSWSTSSRRTYRVLVPTTLSVQGDNDGGVYF